MTTTTRISILDFFDLAYDDDDDDVCARSVFGVLCLSGCVTQRTCWCRSRQVTKMIYTHGMIWERRCSYVEHRAHSRLTRGAHWTLTHTHSMRELCVISHGFDCVCVCVRRDDDDSVVRMCVCVIVNPMMTMMMMMGWNSVRSNRMILFYCKCWLCADERAIPKCVCVCVWTCPLMVCGCAQWWTQIFEGSSFDSIRSGLKKALKIKSRTLIHTYRIHHTTSHIERISQLNQFYIFFTHISIAPIRFLQFFGSLSITIFFSFRKWW